MFLKFYFETTRPYDFNGKTIAFITGKTGNKIKTKKEFFDDVRRWTSRSTKVPTLLIELSKAEKIESGGYDAILGYWVKHTKKIDREKIIKKLKKSRK